MLNVPYTFISQPTHYEPLYNRKPLSVSQFGELFRRRWLDGFVCPNCGSRNAARRKWKRCVHQCRDYRKQTLVTAGTFMHRLHIPLKNWYRGLHIMTAHSNGMSAMQFQHYPGLGSFKSVWLLVHKIHRAMERADGFPLIVNVQANETTDPCRCKALTQHRYRIRHWIFQSNLCVQCFHCSGGSQIPRFNSAAARSPSKSPSGSDGQWSNAWKSCPSSRRGHPGPSGQGKSAP